MSNLDYILNISSLSKNFGGLLAVNNCTLKIQRGSITGIIGPNGSGKHIVQFCRIFKTK